MSPINSAVYDEVLVQTHTANEGRDDSFLIEMARQGDPGAFETLVEPYKRKLFKMILKITQHQEDAEDALQESLLRAYLKLDQFKGHSRFSTWLLSIGINQALMCLRTRRHRPVVSIEEMMHGEDGFRLWDLPETRATPEEQYQSAEVREILEDAIRRLPVFLRTAFVMCHVQEHSRAKAATTLGISVGALKSRSFRARRRIQDDLQEQVSLLRHG